jgi:iron-sulfur cluster repair protein YtfE (RIC family)
MDALELLKQDHDKVKQLFQQVETANPTQAKTLFNKIYHELSIHAIIEEQVFYPVLAKYEQFAPLLKDAYKEHAEAKREMGEIANLEAGSADWQKKVKKLNKDINHHVQDEEEKLFPQVREVLEAQVLSQLGEELDKAKSSKLNGTLLSQPNPLTEAPTIQ